MNNNINIIELIKKNPLNNLNSLSNNKLLEKAKKCMNQDEINFFMTTLYINFNYNKKKDFVIDLDDIWVWLGFSQKSIISLYKDSTHKSIKEQKTIV
jgi:hypothetical protein